MGPLLSQGVKKTLQSGNGCDTMRKIRALPERKGIAMKKIVLILTLAALVLLLAACGGEKQESTTPASTAPVVTLAPGSTAQAGQLPAEDSGEELPTSPLPSEEDSDEDLPPVESSYAEDSQEDLGG